MQQQTSKKERDFQKAKGRQVKRVVYWFIALLAIGLAVFGVVKLVQMDKGGSTPLSLPASVNEILPDDHTIGNPDSPVILVEYSDFQCPACRAYNPTVKQIAEEYKDRILFVYRHYPLPQHFNARITAQASEAAAKQGKFWEMHALIFDNQDTWTTQNRSRIEVTLAQYAEQLGLNIEEFKADLNSDEGKERVTRDLVSGQEAGVSGTPSFFLNGEQILPRNIDEFRTAINEALRVAQQTEDQNGTSTTSIQ